MLFTIDNPIQSSRLVVFSYDISCPSRARKARGVLESIYHAKQYSVFEARLPERLFREVLAELSTVIDPDRDLFCLWWPRDGLRLVWTKSGLVARKHWHFGGNGILVPVNTGNFIVCYDISDPGSLTAVGAIVAPQTMMLQRSVYWLRGNLEQLMELFAQCAPLLGETDRLWAYPLRVASDLWHIGNRDTSILPISTDRWRK